MYKSIGEFADDLKMDRSNLYKVLKKLDIQTVPDEYDARVRLISPQDQTHVIEVVRQRKRSPKLS